MKRHGGRIIGMALIALSLALGAWAWELARTEALKDWLREHPPSSRMWRHGMLAQGYQEITEPRLIQKIGRTLPSLIDTGGSAWVSGGTGWVALFLGDDGGTSLSLYCLRCKDLPSGWVRVGDGWSAFHPILARAEEARKERDRDLRLISHARSPAPRDPREIVY